MAQAISTGTFCEAKWVVDPTAGQGTHTTIQAAITAAAAAGGTQTVFIRPGTYTENLSLSASVNLTAYPCDAANPSVIIKGKATFSGAGTVSISNICLRTNGDYALVVSGNSASVLKVYNCYLDILDASFLNYTSSSTSSYVHFNYCTGAIGTTAITIFVATGAGSAGFNSSGINFEYVSIDNAPSSTTASTSTNCRIRMFYCDIQSPISVTGPGTLDALYSAFRCQNLNTTAITTATSGTSALKFCHVASGSASGVSAGAGTIIQLNQTQVISTNTNAVTGAGTVNFTSLAFPNSSTSVINTTTQVPSYTDIGKWKASGQPCFLAYLGTKDSDVTGDGTAFTIGSGTALTEVFDLDSNFSTATFTAPVTGKYLLVGNCLAQQATAAMTGQLSIVTSNATYNFCNSVAVAGNNGWSCSVVCDMDASDTATLVSTFSGATKVVDIFGGAGDRRTCFSGLLVS